MTLLPDELSTILPDLRRWNDGRGISPTDWLFIEPRMDLPVAYSSLFWPRFVTIGPYVLREDFNAVNLKAWENSGRPREQIEAAMNTMDTLDLLVPVGGKCNELAERQAVYLGRVLAEIHQVKLSRDFPDKQFVVEFWDGTQDHGDDISLSFWQTP